MDFSALPKIIGLAGKKGCGKSTLASHLRWYLDGAVEYSFALPLKRAIREVFGFDDKQLGLSPDPDNTKESRDEFWGETPRKIMQVVGTELFRDKLAELFPDNERFGKGNIWISAFEKWLQGNTKHEHVIVSDVRFPNEAEAIRKLGGEIWLIERPSLSAQTDSHSSEQIQFSPDRVIVNDATSVDDFVKSFFPFHKTTVVTQSDHEFKGATATFTYLNGTVMASMITPTAPHWSGICFRDSSILVHKKGEVGSVRVCNMTQAEKRKLMSEVIPNATVTVQEYKDVHITL